MLHLGVAEAEETLRGARAVAPPEGLEEPDEIVLLGPSISIFSHSVSISISSYSASISIKRITHISVSIRI